MPSDWAGSGGITMSQAKAECPYCGVLKMHMGSTREEAVRVVTDIMNRHVEEKHPEEVPGAFES